MLGQLCNHFLSRGGEYLSPEKCLKAFAQRTPNSMSEYMLKRDRNVREVLQIIRVL